MPDATPTQSSIGAFWPPGQGAAQEPGSSSGQAGQQAQPGEPMEMSQAPEASAQPMETSQAAPTLQEGVAGPSEPGALTVPLALTRLTIRDASAQQRRGRKSSHTCVCCFGQELPGAQMHACWRRSSSYT